VTPDQVHRALLTADLALALGIADARAVAEALARCCDGGGVKARKFLPELGRRVDLDPTQVALLEAELDRALEQAGGDAHTAVLRRGGVDHTIHAALSEDREQMTRVLAHAGAGVRTPLRSAPPHRYQQFKSVGQGGMGIVYLALDTELNRNVAFKVVRPDAGHGDSEAIAASPLELFPPRASSGESARFTELSALFLQEAWVTAGLEHPGIVPVYELGETPDGVPYYTMRFVQGARTIEEALGEATSLEDRLGLLEPFLKVCDTIGYAHAKGVLHRDLKPRNIVMGEYGEVIVLDWGLATETAKRREGDGRPGGQGAESASSTSGGVAGTPGYLPIEAARGNVSEIDERSDIYSLGVILYRILTGRMPHAFESLSELIAKLQSEPPPRASEVVPGVPEALSRICERALARERSDRPESVGVLAGAVRTWQRESSIENESAALLTEAETAFAATEGLAGENLLRQLDRVASATTRILELRPEHAAARELVQRTAELRQRALAERESAVRRRLLQRVAALAVVGAIVVAAVVVWVVDAARRAAEDAREVADARKLEAEEAAYTSQIQAAMAYRASGDTDSARLRLEATDPARRGWEWTYTARSLEECVTSVPMQIPAKPRPSVAPDGRYALFPVGPQTLRLCDLAAGTWSDHRHEVSGVTSLALFADRRSALLGTEKDGLLRVPLEGEMKPQAVWKTERYIRGLSLASDGTRVAIASSSPPPDPEWRLEVIDLRAGRLIAGEELEAMPQSALFSPDASILVTLRGDGVLTFWDPPTLTATWEIDAHQGPIVCAAFSPSGAHLATGSTDRRIRIWSVESGEEERALGLLQGTPISLAFHPDGRTLFSGHADARVRQWSVTTGACLRATGGRTVTEEYVRQVLAFGFARDRELLYVLGEEGIRTEPLGDPLPSILHHESHMYPFAYDVMFGPCGRHLLSCGWDGTARIWDAATRRPVAVLQHEYPAICAQYTHDGGRILVCLQHGYGTHVLALWDLETLTCKRSPIYPTLVPCALHLPEREALVVGTEPGLRILDPQTLELREERPQPKGAWCLALSPDGAGLACGTRKGGCMILDAATLEPRIDFEGHRERVQALAFSPDGERLASGGAGTICIWRVATGEKLLHIQVPKGGDIFSLRFTPDGRRLLSGSRCISIRVWDSWSGRELLQLHGHDNYVHALAWNPGADILASASGDNTVRLWDTRPLRQRLEECDQVLAAEEAMRPRVDALFEEHETLKQILAAIRSDPTLTPLEKHAARNLALRKAQQ
jgi:WD40 repeat protein/serine/threonine protein kinase